MQARIPLSIPDLRGREAAMLAQCVADNWVSTAGPFVTEFERGIAGIAQRAEGVALMNGTAALHMALLAAGVVLGDLVIVPDWTFAASVNAVCHAGAEPLFVDVDPVGLTLDPAAVEAALAEHGTRVKAVIAVDVLGIIADFPALERVVAPYGIPLIEDAAGAIGATRFGRPAGSFGLCATLSFNGNKTLTAGGGGMLVTDSVDLAMRARHISRQARIGQDYRHDAVGYNYRMTNLNAAVGLAQLERLDDMLVAKRRIALRYAAAFAGRNDLQNFLPPDDCESSYWLSTVVMRAPDEAKSLVEFLWNRNIEARVFWLSLSDQQPYAQFPRALRGVSERISGRLVNLPCSSQLTEIEQDRVIDAVLAWSADS